MPGEDLTCCCALFIGLPLLCTFLILLYDAFKNYTPSCSLKEVYVPALDTNLLIFNSSFPAATFIFFDLQLDNNLGSDSVSYEYIHPALAFYYAGLPIANFTVTRFSQGDGKAAHLRDLVETRGEMPWPDALAAVSGGSTVAFTVEFAAKVKVNRVLWITGYEELLLRGDFKVNDSGEKVKKKNKDIKLRTTTVARPPSS